jgi:hypothetical protein
MVEDVFERADTLGAFNVNDLNVLHDCLDVINVFLNIVNRIFVHELMYVTFLHFRWFATHRYAHNVRTDGFAPLLVATI